MSPPALHPRVDMPHPTRNWPSPPPRVASSPPTPIGLGSPCLNISPLRRLEPPPRFHPRLSASCKRETDMEFAGKGMAGGQSSLGGCASNNISPGGEETGLRE